jgi:hypothetical protein
MRGELDEAEANCDRAQRAAKAVSDPQFEIYSGFTCAVLAMDRGKVEQAKSMLGRVRELSDASGNTIYSANSRFLQGQIALEASQFGAARALLQEAAKQYAANEALTGEANSEALLALCAQAEGDSTERDRASEHARQLRTTITSKQEIYVVDIALAQLATGNRARNDALARLRRLAIDAEQRHWISWSLEAQLAEWRLLTGAGDEAAANRVGNELMAKAERYGFGRIVALMKTPKHVPG